MELSLACTGFSFLSATSASEQHQHGCAHAAIDVFVSRFPYMLYQSQAHTVKAVLSNYSVQYAAGSSAVYTHACMKMISQAQV